MQSKPTKPTPGPGVQPARPVAAKSAAPAARTSASAPPPAGRPVTVTKTFTGAELAMAFEGKLERRRFSVGYHLGLLAIAVLMVLLPIVYFGIIAGTGWLVKWHITHDAGMFKYARGGRAGLFIFLIYITPVIAGGLLILAMMLPLFWRGKRGPKPFWVDRREEPLLYAYVENLCDTMRAPRPARIDIIAAASASAHIDNGIFGLVRRKLVLTIGLPLPAEMTMRQFTGVIAHELGHFTQGSSMRLSYLIHNINGWFVRMGFSESGIDRMLNEMMDVEDQHWAIVLMGFCCKLVVGTAKLVLKALALISHALTMGHSRSAEFDADYQGARIVGSEAMGQALEVLPGIDAAFDLAVTKARGGWARKQLPDDLVLFTHAVHAHLPAEIKTKLANEILTAESSWFDTHPPLFVRIGALKKAGLKGVLKLDAPATVLFKDFDELSKMATIDLYQNAVGDALQPEHLVPTRVAAPKPTAPAATATAAKKPATAARDPNGR